MKKDLQSQKKTRKKAKSRRKKKMNSKNIKVHLFLHKFFSASEIGLALLFFLLPYVALAAPITKEILINLTNAERKAQSIQVLGENEILNRVALNKARDIMEKQYFSHTSPEGKPFYKWIEESGYNYRYAGENLAIDFTESEEVMKAWMESPAHRDNILNKNYTQIGIGIMTGTFEDHTSTIVVQIFGQPYIKLETLGENLETRIKGASYYQELSDQNLIDQGLKNYSKPEIYRLDGENSGSGNAEEGKNKLTISLNNEADTGKNNFFPPLDILSLIIIFITALGTLITFLEKIKISAVNHPYRKQNTN